MAATGAGTGEQLDQLLAVEPADLGVGALRFQNKLLGGSQHVFHVVWRGAGYARNLHNSLPVHARFPPALVQVGDGGAIQDGIAPQLIQLHVQLYLGHAEQSSMESRAASPGRSDTGSEIKKREAPVQGRFALKPDRRRCLSRELIVPGTLVFLAGHAILGPRHRLETFGRDGLCASSTLLVGAILDPFQSLLHLAHEVGVPGVLI